MLADDLDSVLVGAHGTVGTETEEHGARHVVRFRGVVFVVGKAGAQHVVVDADREVVLGLVLGQVVINSLDHGRGEFLGGQAVASADHRGHAVGKGKVSAGLGVKEGLDNVLVERFALGAGFLRAVQHGDLFDRGGKGLDELRGGEGAEQAHFQHAYLGVFTGDHGFHRFFHGFGAGTHQDDDVFSVRRAGVVHQVVGAARQGREFVHGLLHNGGGGGIERVDRFTALEINVRILGGTAQYRGVRRQGAFAEGIQPFRLHHGVQRIVGNIGDLADFMGRAEPVEEVHEGNAGFQRGGMGNGGKVRGFLRGGTAKHGPAAGAGAHHVAVVAKNGKGLVGQGPGRHMEHGRSQFPGNLEHVRNHQQEALGCREGRRQGTGLEGAVNGACGAAFTLHFHDGGNGPPQVLPVDGRPAFGGFTHRRRRGNGVNGNDFRKTIGYRGYGFVSVNRAVSYGFLITHKSARIV